MGRGAIILFRLVNPGFEFSNLHFAHLTLIQKNKRLPATIKLYIVIYIAINLSKCFYLCAILISAVQPRWGGDLTKNHHKAQPPLEVSTPIPLLSPDDLTIPFHQQKSPKIISKRVKLPLRNHFKWQTYGNTPFFQISLCRYSLSKTPLKLGKWLSLSMDFGQEHPGLFS